MKRILTIMILGLSLLSAQTLTLPQAEKMALENNLQIKLSEASYDKAVSVKRETMANFLPEVSSYYQLQDNLELQVLVIDFDGDGPTPPQELKMGSQYSATGGLSASYAVFTGGAIISGQKLSNEAVKLSALSLQSQVNTVINTVRTLYYQIQMLNSLVDATEKSLLSSKESYELIIKKEAVGRATRLDVLQSQVRYESYKPQLVSLKNQYQTAISNLKAYMNVEMDTKLSVTGQLKVIDNPYAFMTLEDVLELAESKRLELKMADVQKSMAKHQKTLALSSIMPKVQLSSALSWTANTDDIEVMDYNRSSNVAVAVSLPLFAGGKRAHQIQQAKIGVKEADYQYEQTRDYILTDIETAFNKISETYVNIQATENVIRQAEEALRLSKLMYDAGSATQVDLMTAESGYLGAVSNYISSVFQYNLAVESMKKSLNYIKIEGMKE